MKRTILITIAISLFMMISLSHADYHYVSHTGSNEYPYSSWEAAADSIQKAVDATEPHDTVFISSGEWVEHVAVQDFDSIGIVGMGRDSTFWTSTEQNVEILTIDYGCLVSGITFHDQGFAGVAARSHAGVTITNCNFIRLDDGTLTDWGPTEISNCIFDSCRYFAIDKPFGSGEYFIANNLIRNCGWEGAIEFYGGAAIMEKNIIINDPTNHNGMCTVCGIMAYGVIRNNLVANTFHGISTNAPYKYNNVAMNFTQMNGWGMGASATLQVFGNILLNNRQGVYMDSNLANISYNAFWQNAVDDIYSSGYQFDSIGNIFSDPMMVNPDSGDYHLQAFSPCIDAGDPNVLDPDGSRSDIGFYGGPFGETYPYRDLPPHTPDSLSYLVSGDSLLIFWRQNYEADFWRYIVNRDTISGFTPWAGNIISEPETSFYADTNWDRFHNYYYKIAAYDNQGNLSPYSEELEVRNVGIFGEPLNHPTTTYIKSNYPNPFNARTTIVYYVADLGPIPAEVEINIYDISGRLIRRLLKAREEVGEHRIIWDGKDGGNHELASGVYFARIAQWGIGLINPPRKLVLVR